MASVAAMVFVVGMNVEPWGSRAVTLVQQVGLAAGAGLAAGVGRWELWVRTAAGSAAWLRVESFRRFLASSKASHAEDSARRGLLRDYTGWAVAVGEVDRWAEAVAASTVPSEAPTHFAFVRQR